MRSQQRVGPRPAQTLPTRREIRLRANAPAIRRHQASAVFDVGQPQQLGRRVHVPGWHANEGSRDSGPIDLHGADVCPSGPGENTHLIRDILVP
jgi:hypothetical protein